MAGNFSIQNVSRHDSEWLSTACEQGEMTLYLPKLAHSTEADICGQPCLLMLLWSALDTHTMKSLILKVPH